MDIDSKKAEFESMDINVNIGDMLFNIIIDTSFFYSDDDFSFPCHNHGAFELHIIEKGTGELLVGDKTIPLTGGVCCLIAPNMFHTQKELPYDKIYKYCMKFTYKTTKRSVSAPLTPEVQNIKKFLSNDLCIHWQDTSDILSLVRMIQNEILSNQIGYYTIIQSCFMQILIRLVRSIAESTQVDYEINQKSIDQKRTIIIESFFYQNYMHTVYIEDLAVQLGICVRQVDRIMRRYYNISFKNKILETRIDIAKDLLINTPDSICCIARKVGYSLSANFSKIFKKKVGIPPEEFRARAHLQASCSDNQTTSAKLFP